MKREEIRYLEGNLRYIAPGQKVLLDLLQREPHISHEITLVPTKRGTVTMRYRDVLLHSAYDPEREALKFVESQKVQHGDQVLVYGFALGYHVTYIARSMGAEGTLFVLEPNVDILKAAFSVMDLHELLARKNLYIITGDSEEIVAMRFFDVINKHFTDARMHASKVIIHQPSLKCMPAAYERLRNSFELLAIERKAPDVFGEENSVNLRSNIDAVLCSAGVERLRNNFKEVPAFFINAGPSLDRALPLLTAYAARALFFASDTALPALMEQGIEPDFVLTVDPQERSFDHFREYTHAHSILLFTPTAAREVVRHYRGKKMVVLQKEHSLTKQFEEELGYKGTTTAGSSVSCMGLDILLQMGCNPIVFIGTDYAFPGGKAYSSHIAATKKWPHQVSRLNTLESMHRDVLEDHKVISATDKFGREVLTHQTLYLYLKQIETIVAQHSTVRFYSFMSQGASIEGVESLVLCEELDALLQGPMKPTLCIDDDSLDEELKKRILGKIEHEALRRKDIMI